jgi:UDP-glucose 4-epimerase
MLLVTGINYHLALSIDWKRVDMRILVTGGAGFIGSNLVDSLISDGHSVTAFDNLSTGRREFVSHLVNNPQFSLIEGDLQDQDLLSKAVAGKDAVVHLAANADVRFGWNHPRRDFEQNVLVTQNVLEAMRTNGVRRILFSSTGSVYGDCKMVPTPETAPFPIQTSLYGASKCAAEGLISSYAEAGHVSSTIFRFVSILGPRYTHGHIIDFVAQLAKDPENLRVLGNGTQRKSYLHVTDCVNAICNRLIDNPKFEVLNLGIEGYCEVNDSISWITKRLGIQPQLNYTGGDRGWIGDNPFIYLDTTAMKSNGWSPTHTIQSAVEDTVDWIKQNQWVLEMANTD